MIKKFKKLIIILKLKSKITLMKNSKKNKFNHKINLDKVEINLSPNLNKLTIKQKQKKNKINN